MLKEKKFEKSREKYNEALKKESIEGVKENILKSFYNEKKYDEVIKYPFENNFIKGNSYAFLGESSSDKKKEYFEKSLEEYKLAMKVSDDINIKKNYELILKKLEEENQKQNKQNKQNNKDKQNQNQQNKDNNKQSQDNQQNQDNQNNQNKQSQDNQNNNDKQDQNNQQNKNDNNKENNTQQNQDNQNNNKDKSNNSNNNEPQPSNEEQNRKEEITAILKRLEGNEKQSFKNNERVMDISDNSKHNRW